MTERALLARRESKTVDFKRSFDPTAPGEWCELVKDVVAMANSGGGYIVVGVEDNGEPAPIGAAAAMLSVDPAHLTDKVAKYTSVQFDGFGLTEAVRGTTPVAIIAISAATRPLVFDKPGTYATGDGKQKTAFGVGTLYVRHGAKSEPATSEDLARIIERSLQLLRKEWMSGVRRVVNAPTGSTVSVLPGAIRQSKDPSATPIRLTTDPTAPEYRLVDPDTTHPWRQKELLEEVNGLLEEGTQINSFDIQAIRRLHNIGEDPRFFHKARFATPRYSPEFRDWLVARHSEDPDFFAKAREEFSRRRNVV